MNILSVSLPIMMELSNIFQAQEQKILYIKTVCCFQPDKYIEPLCDSCTQLYAVDVQLLYIIYAFRLLTESECCAV